jgi:hypothetical protein
LQEVAREGRAGEGHSLIARLSAFAGHPAVAILALFAVSRLALIAIGVIAADRFGTGFDHSITDLFCRHDCNWYVLIVENGYSFVQPAQPGATPFAFFPLFPLTVQVVAAVSGLSALDAAILVANGLALAGLGYVYAYGRLMGISPKAALIAVALLCFLPYSFVLSAGYSESLFLLLLAAAMYHLRREQFLLSGVAAALLSATRPNGFVFVVFPIAWLVRRYGRDLLRQVWIRPIELTPLVLAPLGLFAFWAFSFALTGDAFANVSTSVHGWDWGAAFPLDNMIAFLRDDSTSRFWFLGGVAGFIASLLLLYYRMYEEFVLCLAMFGLWSLAIVPYSIPRYVLVLFPIWIAVGRALEQRPLAALATFGSAASVNGLLMVAWTLRDRLAI